MKKIITTAFIALAMACNACAATTAETTKKICEFIRSIHLDPDVNIYDSLWIERHCSEKFKKYLRNEYEFDGDGMAMWLLEGQAAGEDVRSVLLEVSPVAHKGKQVVMAKLNRFLFSVNYIRTIYYNCTYDAANDNIVIKSLEWGKDEGFTEPISLRMNVPMHVDGGPGILQFVKALAPAVGKMDEVEPIVDTKAGYFLYKEKRTDDVLTNVEFAVTYWNRNDKSKLVIASYRIQEGFGEDIADNCCTQAYLYNAAKQRLEPIEMPVINGPDFINYAYCILPRNGKDIIIRPNMYEEVYHTMKWNGMKFVYNPVPNPTKP